MQVISIVVVFSLIVLSCITSAESLKTINIGVLSPKEGGMRETGDAHSYWIRTGLERYGKFVVDDAVYEIRIIEKDTKSRESDEFCLQHAKSLVEEHEVALILGPVSSGCVKSILSEELPVPIISTLASATSLNKIRTQWFFRANGYDKVRVAKLWNYVDSQINRSQPQKWVILHDETAYGRGLVADLEPLIQDSIDYEKIQLMDSEQVLTDSLIEAFSQGNLPFNFFILGTNHRVIAALKKLKTISLTKNLTYQVYTVGSSNELKDHSSENVISIGEMQFDIQPNSKLKPELETVRDIAIQHGINLYPTTYQAARFIVPQAIQRGLDNLVYITDITALREEIRQQLEQGEFDSLQPPYPVAFNRGNMSDVFRFPVYKIKSSYQEIPLNGNKLGWIEFFNSGASFNFLESPLKVKVVGHGLDNDEQRLMLKRGGDKILQESKPFTLRDGEEKWVTFHVYYPGEYQVYSKASSHPKFASFKVSFSPFYLISVIAAVLAVFLKHKLNDISAMYRLELIMESCIMGVAVAFVSTYIQYSVLPFTASDWNLVNAVLYGFVGGWFGPSLVTALTNRVLPQK